MIKFTHKGDLKSTTNYLKKHRQTDFKSLLETYAKEGLVALVNATPVDTGLTAASWSYEIEKTSTGVSIYWKNSNIQNGVNIAIIIQYGHGTPSGAYVQGRDYINPVMQPLFDKIANDIWGEVRQ